MITMRIITLLFVIFTSLTILFLNDVKGSEINCRDLKTIPIIGSLFVISSKTNHQLQVSFFISTLKNREPVEVGPNDWTALQNLEPSKKTIIIIHGYKSGGRKRWVLEMKDKLLDFQEANVLLVDWSAGSYSKNYVSAAKNTQIVAGKLLNFLQSAKVLVEGSNNMLWNHLHFIGHSLGAQISGQTASLLKDDHFWKIERVTGLDPAKPCFKELQTYLKLDKDDAEFVDIIHTQAGNGGSTDGLGLKESIGHMDFYVNGGGVQPECTGSSFNPRWNTMICSHRLAYKYFTESIDNAINDKCKFIGYPWDGTSEDAMQIFNSKINEQTCSDCPEMGINAVNSNKRGKFLVLVGASQSHCQFSPEDKHNIEKVIKRLKD